MTSRVQKPDDSLGQNLLREAILTPRQLDLANRRSARQRIQLHRAIIDLNFASETDIYRALAAVHSLPFLELDSVQISPELTQQVPLKVALRFRTLPVEQNGGMLTLAFSEPPTASDLANLRLALTQRLKVTLMTPSSIHAGISRYYGLGADTVQQLRDDRGLSSLSDETLTFDAPITTQAGDELPEEEASISKLVTQIVSEALRLDATDVHIEPYESHVRLRYRIDGLLREIPVPAGLQQLYNSIVSRLKIMAGLNIAERRLPHDGRIAMRQGNRQYDLRVSILPTRLGEAICLRVLSRNDLVLAFDRLGMPEQEQQTLEQMMRLSQGMILLTGPTGSGKTTTLYAALQHSRDEGRKIITVEDPVEYQMDGISQIQVRPEIGLTFSSGLRSILRHDPDVVLIGEIRDLETAEISVRSSQTGHLVLSTLHTNDSISAVIRLVEMGIEPFLVASSLICSIAQRLVRRNCRGCLTDDPIVDPNIRAEMSAALDIHDSEIRAQLGVGCLECAQLGYRGREAIYEFFFLNDNIVDAIQPGLTLQRLRRLASEQGWRPLRENAWRKLQEGSLSIDELQRMTSRPQDLFLRNA
ncbi:MAG: type II/IV secretion system protein [Puniceicoccaceae bacterium]|nr:MAG: type II/IV secretion system protein [Puniceicoccaceae bacterium]